MILFVELLGKCDRIFQSHFTNKKDKIVVFCDVSRGYPLLSCSRSRVNNNDRDRGRGQKNNAPRRRTSSASARTRPTPRCRARARRGRPLPSRSQSREEIQGRTVVVAESRTRKTKRKDFPCTCVEFQVPATTSSAARRAVRFDVDTGIVDATRSR